MSFFTTPVKQLAAKDLEELVLMRAQENLQLEFKREQADRDEHLKKVSSFANTLGGRIVYGIEQDKESRATRLAGVDRDDAFESQLTSWCAHYLDELLVPEVSGAITLPGTSRVAYVVDVQESELAPHFIRGRRGCYIRTNEGSLRFDAKLAEQGELRALLNRREEVRARAAALKKRSEERAEKRLGILRETLNTWAPWAPFTFRAALRFPRKPLVLSSALASLVEASRYDFAANPFPRTAAGVRSHAESLIYLKPRHELLNLLEVTTFGSVSYTDFMQADAKLEHNDAPGAAPLKFSIVPIARALGAAHLGAKFASRFLEKTHARGTLILTLSLKDLKGIGCSSRLRTWLPAVPYLDESIEVSSECSCDTFIADWKSRLHELWRDLYFALGWMSAHGADGTAAIQADLEEAYQFYNLKPGVLD